jgi:hypothetical protein
MAQGTVARMVQWPRRCREGEPAEKENGEGFKRVYVYYTIVDRSSHTPSEPDQIAACAARRNDYLGT